MCRTASLQEILGVSDFHKFDSVSRSCEDDSSEARLTVEATCPSSTRMFRAQLLMCLKRSGPNKIPPYHLDTTTMTLRTSRICEERKARRMWNQRGLESARRDTGDHNSQQVQHRHLNESSSLLLFWSQKQSRQRSRFIAFHVFIKEKAHRCISWTLVMEGSVSFSGGCEQFCTYNSYWLKQLHPSATLRHRCHSDIHIHLLMEGERSSDCRC